MNLTTVIYVCGKCVNTYTDHAIPCLKRSNGYDKCLQTDTYVTDIYRCIERD